MLNMNLNQVTVPSTNVPQAITFYKKLGLKLIVHTHDEYARFESPDGDATFSIHFTPEIVKGTGIWLYFEVPDVAKKVTELRAKGITFETEPTAQSWLWTEARFKDLDGNQIIIYSAGDNRKNPPWRFLDDK